MNTDEKISEIVKDQYESLPYPPRDPGDEKNRLLKTYFGDLDCLSNFCYEGENLSKKKLNILDAGCGTGDTTVMLAELLKKTRSKIVALDVSKSSLDVARERCKIRGLENVEFVQGSLLNLPKMNFKSFDYIVCCGVLHHLKDPASGLNCLKQVLKDDGIIAIMVYAKYGRTAVYMTQEIMKKINKGETNLHVKIENTKKILQGYHDAHWNSLNLLKDDVMMGDAGLYDLYLHSQDTSYTIPELFSWIEDQCNLNIVYVMDSFLYDPLLYIKNKEFSKKILSLPPKEKLTLGELMGGQISKHMIYVSKRKIKKINYLSDRNKNLYCPFLRQSLDYINSLDDDQELNVGIKGVSINIIATKFNKFIISNLKGDKTIQEIIDEAAEKFELDKEKVLQKWKHLAKFLTNYEMILFKRTQ